MPALKKTRAAAGRYINGVHAARFEMCVSAGDPALIVAVLADIVKAYGVARLARETGMSSDSLEQLMAPESDPKFSAIVTVVNALGLTLHARNRH